MGWEVIASVALARGGGWGGVGCDNIRCTCTLG